VAAKLAGSNRVFAVAEIKRKLRAAVENQRFPNQYKNENNFFINIQ
jgi:hypothetical protein